MYEPASDRHVPLFSQGFTSHSMYTKNYTQYYKLIIMYVNHVIYLVQYISVNISHGTLTTVIGNAYPIDAGWVTYNYSKIVCYNT